MRSRWAWAVLAAGLGVYLVLQFGLVWGAIRERHAPLEADDAYSYIVKAEQFLHGYNLRTSPALRDLERQLTAPTDDPTLASARGKDYARLIYPHHRLYSALLAGLHLCGLPWEEAYNLMQLVGVIFLGGAIAYFLVACWGPAVAGCALFLLAPVVFARQGLHYVVPSNLCLGVALLTWARIVHTQGRGRLFAAIGILAILGMHEVGKLYAIAVLALQLSYEKSLQSRRALLILGAIIVAAVAAVVAVTGRVYFSPPLWLPPPQWRGWSGVWQNLGGAVDEIHRWLGGAAGDYSLVKFVVIPLVCFGLWWPRGERRRAIWRICLLFVVFLLASLLLIVPGFPAEVFARLWVAAAVFLTGALAQVLVAFSESLFGLVHEWRSARSGGVASGELRRAVLLHVLAGFLLLVLVGRAFRYQLGCRQQARGLMVSRYALVLKECQAKTLAALCGPEGAVLYRDYDLLVFFLCHGGHRFGAVHYPAVAGTPEEALYVHANQRLRYVASWSPVGVSAGQSPPTPRGWLPLTPGCSLTLVSPSGLAVAEVRVHVANESTTAAVLKFSLLGVDGSEVYLGAVSVAPGHDGWVAPPRSTVAEAHMVRIAVADTGARCWVKGVRSDARDTLQWPWDKGLNLRFRSAGGAEQGFAFDSSQLFPGLRRRVTVVADEGSTVLARIME